MEVDCSDAKWTQLIETIDKQIHTVALNANVSDEELRHRYIMCCLHIARPFEYNKYGSNNNNNNNIGDNADVKQKTELNGTTANETTDAPTAKFKGTAAERRIAAGDNITVQHGKECGFKIKVCQNSTANSYSNVHPHPIRIQQQSQQHLGVGGCAFSNQKTIIRQRPQQSFYSRNVRGSSVPPYRTASVPINSAHQIHQASADNCCKIGNDINNNSVTITKGAQPKTVQSNGPKSKKVAKFYCDIEAALAGEISDVEDDEKASAIRGAPSLSKPPNGSGARRTSASLAKETIWLVETQLKKIKQPETRVVRYPNGKPLALNVLHKVYVVELDGAYAWVRLCDNERPPCFDAAHVTMKALKHLEWEELIPGTPCVVLARFNPLDIVNDGIARELTEFESHARAVVEECHSATQTVTVRLVDFGFQLTNFPATAIKPLTIAFDGPPLALRLQIDMLPKQQKESLCRYATLSVRLTVARDKQFLCWSKTWKALDAQKQNWNKDSSDCSSSLKSVDVHNLKDQHFATSSFGPVARAFVSSWLNKDHKRASGRGIEAALCGITERRADLPPSEFAVKPTNEFTAKQSLQSTQSSNESDQTAPPNAAPKMVGDDWPVLGQVPNSSKKTPLLPLMKKKEGKRKEKRWCAMEDNPSSATALNRSLDLVRNGITAARVQEISYDASNGQKASSSMTTVHTCRDLH